MTHTAIDFSDLLPQYCLFHFGSDKGKKVYSYYLAHAEPISYAIKYNKILEEDYFLEISFILNAIERDIYKYEIEIYYVEFPYEDKKAKCISYKDFIKENYLFYKGLGQANISNSQSAQLILLQFSRKILDCLVDHAALTNIFNHTTRSNGYMKKIEKINNLFQEKEKDVFEKYNKNYTQLTKEEFRESIEIVLGLKKIPQHISDPLWYCLRDPADEKHES